MRKVLMSGAAFLTSSVTLTGEEIESLASDESLKNMEKQLSLLERYLNELPTSFWGWASARCWRSSCLRSAAD